jgi:hypothetical protein
VVAGLLLIVCLRPLLLLLLLLLLVVRVSLGVVVVVVVVCSAVPGVVVSFVIGESVSITGSGIGSGHAVLEI